MRGRAPLTALLRRGAQASVMFARHAQTRGSGVRRAPSCIRRLVG
jgi:hypothetical protein